MIPLDILEETINNQDNNLEIETINKMDLYQKINSLDEKSRQVIYLRLIGEFSFKEIGEALGLSERTIENHRASAYKKLGVSSAIEVKKYFNV